MNIANLEQKRLFVTSVRKSETLFLALGKIMAS